MLRERMLHGIAEYPGELVRVDAAAVSELLASVRQHFFIAESGIIAVRPGSKSDRTFVLTLGGIYDACGRRVGYHDLHDIASVGGWTQDYVKFRNGDEIQEINHLGDRKIATFCRTYGKWGRHGRLWRRPHSRLLRQE